jgi:hypothetical protein
MLKVNKRQFLLHAQPDVLFELVGHNLMRILLKEMRKGKKEQTLIFFLLFLFLLVSFPLDFFDLLLNPVGKAL